MANYAGFQDYTPCRAEEAITAEGDLAAPKVGTARHVGSPCVRRSLDGRPRFANRFQNLGDEALRLGRLRRARAAKPDPELFLAPTHRAAAPRWSAECKWPCAGQNHDIAANNRATCHRPTVLPAKSQVASAAWMKAWQGLLSCPLPVGSCTHSRLPLPFARNCDPLRLPAKSHP